MPTSATAAPQARLVIQDAFDRFKDTLAIDDTRSFDSTTLQDVKDAARDIENDLGQWWSLCNMRKIQPFFAGLERYSDVVGTLCNGTPYLPYIWVRVHPKLPDFLLITV
jgi:hypothetical protein